MAAALPSATMGLGSLVFDCEVDDISNTRDIVLPTPRSREKLSQDKEKIIHFSSPENSYTMKLLRDVRYFVNEERDPDAILLATKLSAVGYSVNVRTALGGGTACFRNLRHEFLMVRGHGNFEGVEFIVEPRFREHFSIPHPTEEYSELLSHAPDVFVGVGGRLVPIVQTLCEAMADSFARKSLTLPPWRRTQSMLSKWMPNRARDMSFSRGSAPPHNAFLSHEPDSPNPSSSGAPAPAGAGHGPHGPDASGLPFLRISDPLCVRGGHTSSSYRQQQQVSATQQQNPEPRDEWVVATHGFIPFGGAGGCSSDTEGPSPPAAPEVLTSATAVASNDDGGGGGGGPSGRLSHPCNSGEVATVTATAGGTAAAGCTVRPRGGGGSGGSGHSGNSGLLASRLQQNAQAGGTAAIAADGPYDAQRMQDLHQNRYHCQGRVLETRPPLYCGEAPIHRIRMGFRITQPQTEGPSGAPQVEVRTQVQGQARTQDRSVSISHRVGEGQSQKPSRALLFSIVTEKVYQDVTTLLSRANTNVKSPGTLYSLASALAGLGYDVCIRNALSGGSECFKSLRHAFILVRGTGEFRGMEFIVEPSLRQHFSIPHPSPEYDYVLSRTPDVFVGGSCRLVPVVQLLCALMAYSFQRQGLPLPPWRKETAMMSKWMPHPARIRDLRPRLGCTSFLAIHTLPSVQAASVPGPFAAVAPSPMEGAPPTAPMSCRGEGEITGARGPDQILGASSSGCSNSRVGGVGNPVSLPNTDPGETVDKLDECSSPCAGPFSPAEDTGSFFFTSEASCTNSPVHVYDMLSLVGSLSYGSDASADAVLNAGGARAGSPSSFRRNGGHHRPTATGMLPCPYPRTGLLSARMMFESLAARTATPLPKPPAAAATAATATATLLIDASDCDASSDNPWVLRPPVAEAGDEERCGYSQQTQQLAQPGSAPTNNLFDQAAAAAAATAATESLQTVAAGGVQVNDGGAVIDRSPTAAAAPARLSQRSRGSSEWLPWGLPAHKRCIA
ncbi:hypothetical protein VOLCADRAFT_89362 [Volvox carteri f. nagariensis]|uniref:Uncharacterized protein n=1 Tax=Volvox carteri f. nagariensis TaxID=3068 RepID=D8TRI1_VOLCA|nr:uncharacterized protein VOLCADRAFT_89362 [Volvox carteri f. nagariensis]EFJ49897.1 hypothetical protein VOLCADRAFT_89362 [Volvox carteri f. nagariensis]|eukprot:XP_002948962.1 hypothetical protein VOLCADRAFT_89362 [Volvox carteri f. nagariensis]